MLEYRIIAKDEEKQILDIRDYCFRHVYQGKTLEDFRNWIKASTTIGAFDKEKLASQLMILPLQMNVHNQIYSMGGIGFVAAYPEYRSSGVMKQVMIHALKQMREQGQLISVLGPFSVSFYRHFGWEVFFDRLNYTLPIEDLPYANADLRAIIRFDYDQVTHGLELVKQLYTQYADKTNGMMQRDEKWWRRLEMRQPKAVFAVAMNEQGEPEGYIRYTVQDMTFIILDFIAMNSEAEQQLWQYVKVHESNVSVVEGAVSAQDSFGSLWTQPQFEKQIVQDKMIRIVDVEKFLSAYPFHSIEKSLYLNVTDQFASWNQGVYKIESKKVTKIVDKDLKDCLQMDITSLSAYLAGYHDIEWYRYQNKVRATNEVMNDWNKAVPKGFPQFYGHF